MEPNIPSPQFEQGRTPERRPSPSPEEEPKLPSLERPSLESERHEKLSAAAAAAVDAMTTPVLPAPSVPIDPVVQEEPIIGSTPTTASDDDLIEKEWVDKAKKIIAATKDDPYKREEAVGQLQREYLRKRYGKELGAAE